MASQGASAAADLAAGVAAVDITPPLGYRMAGYFNERLNTGVHDPLHARALVLRQGDRQAALVVCDLIGLPANLSRHARRLASEKTDIPAANILIAATHAHTGPLYFGALRNHLHEAAVAREGKDPCESVDYPAQLVERLVRVIAEAHAAARPVRIEAGAAEQLGLSFNRRFHLKDGSVRFNPGVLNPDIVRAAGPIDPQVGILLLRDAQDGRPIAAVTNFALHLDTLGGTLYSADYPHYLEQSLRKSYGDSFVSLFFNGTCGDINHVDVTAKERLKTERIGTTLAETVQAKLPSLKPIAAPDLDVRSATVTVPLQQYTPAQREQARKDMAYVGTSERSFLDQVMAYKIVDLALHGSTHIELDVQVFRLSADVALVGLPGEVFVELGLAIKRGSPFGTTLVAELCNDTPDYIPTRKAFGEGSYEVTNSRVAPGGGEQLVETALRLLRELRPPKPR